MLLGSPSGYCQPASFASSSVEESSSVCLSIKGEEGQGADSLDKKGYFRRQACSSDISSAPDHFHSVNFHFS